MGQTVKHRAGARGWRRSEHFKRPGQAAVLHFGTPDLVPLNDGIIVRPTMSCHCQLLDRRARK